MLLNMTPGSSIIGMQNLALLPQLHLIIYVTSCKGFTFSERNPVDGQMRYSPGGRTLQKRVSRNSCIDSTPGPSHDLSP